MRWETFRRPEWVLAWLAIFVGLLVDFQEAATKMGEFLPIIRGFLPAVAIGGTVFFTVWLVPIVVTKCVRMVAKAKAKAKSKLPTEKLKACRCQIQSCLDSVDDALKYEHLITTDDFQKIVVLTQTKLAEFEIDSPDFSKHDPRTQSGSQVWYQFLLTLSICSKTGNLTVARSIMKSIREWK